VADTIQAVDWALEFTCPLRSSDAAADPPRACREISRASIVSRYLAEPGSDFGIVGDACITSCIMLKVPKGLTPDGARTAEAQSSVQRLLNQFVDHDAEFVHFPSDGFLISREFEKIGGLEGLVSMCVSCPANALQPGPAGCAGSFYRSPDSPQLEQKLRAAVARLGLTQAVADAFWPTNPLWYGFWIRSPLDEGSCELIGAIFAEMMRADSLVPSNERGTSHLDRRQMQAFTQAAQIARQQGLRLHVRLAPPGHTDLGFYTVFPHCPNCKAESDLKRWQQHYPTESSACRVCGVKYSPAATTRSDRDVLELHSLRESLGSERFAEFVKAYLLARGYEPGNAQRVIEAAEAAEAYGEEKARETQIRQQKREQYIRNVVYAGFNPKRLHDEDDDDEDDLQFLRADEFLKLLRRCRKLGVHVVSMIHHSKIKELCIHAWDCGEKAELVFDAWRKKGCSEWFGASLAVPDSILDAPEDPD